MHYNYSFCVWPHERGFCPEVFKLFGSLNHRIKMVFTEDQFGLFRAALERHGFMLREIERVPYHDPETIT